MSVEKLNGVSEAELEYAYRYQDYLELGDEYPDATGFDPKRILLIEQAVSKKWTDQLRVIRGSKRNP